jgi:hypothetical protein
LKVSSRSKHARRAEKGEETSPNSFFPLLSKVTRFGYFSPIGWLFTLGSLFEKQNTGPNYWATYFHSKSCVFILTKPGLGCILGIFSQTHPVTLLLSQPPLLCFFSVAAKNWNTGAGSGRTWAQRIIYSLSCCLQRFLGENIAMLLCICR